MSVLSFHSDPGKKGTPAKNVMLYGDRVKRIYEERGVLV